MNEGERVVVSRVLGVYANHVLVAPNRPGADPIEVPSEVFDLLGISHFAVANGMELELRLRKDPVKGLLGTEVIEIPELCRPGGCLQPLLTVGCTCQAKVVRLQSTFGFMVPIGYRGNDVHFLRRRLPAKLSCADVEGFIFEIEVEDDPDGESLTAGAIRTCPPEMRV